MHRGPDGRVAPHGPVRDSRPVGISTAAERSRRGSLPALAATQGNHGAPPLSAPQVWRSVPPDRMDFAAKRDWEVKHAPEGWENLMTQGVSRRGGPGTGGQLISSALLRAQTERTAANRETNKARDACFRQKHGFRVHEHVDCHSGRETKTKIREGGKFHT